MCCNKKQTGSGLFPVRFSGGDGGIKIPTKLSCPAILTSRRSVYLSRCDSCFIYVLTSPLSIMSGESALFLPKKKDRLARAANRTSRGPPGPAAAGPSASIAGTTLPRKHVGLPKSTLPIASGSGSELSAPSASGYMPRGAAAATDETKPNPNLTEIKLYSTDPGSGQRFSLMKFMSARDFDPTQISKPVLMNRKFPGPREPPIHALDDEGKIVGKYIYSEDGKPVLGANGLPTIERKNVGQDPDLVGGVPGQKRKIRKGVKEVYHQDIDVLRMKREEAVPWVLETGKPRPQQTQAQQLGHVPEHWVGRMTEAASLPTVLLINDGRLDSGFEVVPLGRTYRFNPERPFKALDSDAANKLVRPIPCLASRYLEFRSDDQR